MHQNFNRQYEVKERNGVNSQSLNSRLPQKQLALNQTTTNQQQINMLKKSDTFQSKNVMTFNDFQKHIQNLNYVNQVSQQCQATSTRSNQDEKNNYQQYNQPLSNQNKQNTQHFSQNQIDQKYGKSFNNSFLQEEQKAFSNTQNQIQSRSQKYCPLPPSQTSIQQDQSNNKKNAQSQSISNLVKNNNFQKNSAQSDQIIEQNNNNYSKNTNIVNNLQQQSSSQSASYLNSRQQIYTNQQEQQKQQQVHVSNRWLFTNQNQTNNQNQNNDKNSQSVSNFVDLQNFQTNITAGGKLTSNQQSFQNTPRDKRQMPQQNQKNNHLDFESSQQQTSKNQASQYTTKNTQFIRNKEPQTFQSILQQQQNQVLNSHPNQQTLQNGVQSHNFPQTNDFEIPAETPKQKFFTKIQYNNNNISSDNISINSLLKRNSDKKNNLRNITPPDSTIRFKISNQNNMETPQCNFSTLIIKNDQSHQQLPRKNLNHQLKLESIDQENYYSYNPQADRQNKIDSKTTPSQYESRIQELKQLVNDSENILNTSESKIQINEESTPINNKHKQRYKLEEYQQANDKNYDYKSNNNNNNLNNGTENSLSVEEHIDDSILDEKISRSMFKANPSQHIQQKVQYECITIKCQNCQYEQQLQLKKILENIKQSLSSNVFMNNFIRDNSFRNEVSEFNINTQDQKKYNLSSSSTKNINFHNNLDYDKLSNQIKEVKEQLSPETTLNSINENSQDPNKTIRQLNCLASATYLDLSKKSQENQRSSSSTCNLNSNKFKQNNYLKLNNDHELNVKIQQINEQLKLEVKQLKQNLTQKQFELEFQQQKMDDMNTQIKTLTLKLQEIQQKYSLDQQIIQALEIENRKLIESITNVFTMKLKIS